MNIESRNYDGSGNWIVASETKPYFDAETLVIRQSEWRTNGGRATIDSYVLVNTSTLTSVFVAYGYFGKYRGGSSYYWHFRNGERIEWKKLDDGERMMILDGVDELLPKWAKLPGKLKRDYLKPHELRKLEIDEQGTIYGYKYLAVTSDGLYCSPQKSSCIWINGELIADKEPAEDNSHGIYAVKNRKSTVLYDYRRAGRVLVRLALSGTVVEANEGLRAQQAQIVEILL